MESIGYMLVYFMKGGKLPWMGLKTEDIRERYRMIGHIKEEISTTKLCAGINREFGTYLRYIKTLKFTDKPDYNYAKNLFRNCLLNIKSLEDNVFDWMILASDNPTPTPTVNTATASPEEAANMVEKIALNNGHHKDPLIVVEDAEEADKKVVERRPRDTSRSPRNSQNFGNVDPCLPEYCSPCISVVVSDYQEDQEQVMCLLSSLTTNSLSLSYLYLVHCL